MVSKKIPNEKTSDKKTESVKTVKPLIKAHVLRTLLLCAIVLLIGLGIGFTAGQQKETTVVSLPVPEFIKLPGSAGQTNDKNIDLSLFWDVWNRLENNYVDKSKLDKQKMVWGAIRGMTQALGDPYTVFLPPEENKETRDDLSGTFEGIGAQLGMKNERIVVIAPLEGMPAEKAGIKAGDYILAVDGVETYGWSVPEAVNKIRGPKNSSVTLTILHEGEKETKDIKITRDQIEVPTVKLTFRDNTAVLSLYQFADKTDKQWTDAVETIRSTCYKNNVLTCKGMVLDVRNNPGGLLDSAVYISSEFISDGIVVTQEFGNGKRNEFKVNRKGELLDIPVVVLVNKGSASASEIVAGALKVRKGAKIVGEQSFGKGSIQDREELAGGAGLHITTAKWLMPDNTWINGTGILPDVVVKDDEQTITTDEQLEKAIQILTQM